MTVAMPAVKPVVTGCGMNSMKRPSRIAIERIIANGAAEMSDGFGVTPAAGESAAESGLRGRQITVEDRDPRTGQCNSISTQYVLHAIPAFVVE